MSTTVAIIQIDDSSDKTITGKWQFDHPNGGSLVFPIVSGTLPATASLDNEIIIFNNTLYTWQNGASWEPITATGGDAPNDAAYLVISATGSLTNARTIDVSTGLTSSDGGSGNPFVIQIDNNVVATISGTTFTGPVIAQGGLSGSLQVLSTGETYLAAGQNIEVTTGSNGQVTISFSGTLGVTDHGVLTGLIDDDHEQYYHVGGTRPLSGDMDAGSFNIINVGTGSFHSLTGSLTLLSNGDPYIVAEGSVTITTSSIGQVIISGSATGGGGDISGPGSSTDNALVRWDGTDGSTLQNSAVILDDSNNLSGSNAIIANEFTGSLTKLTNGDPYIVAASGSLATISTGSNGQIIIGSVSSLPIASMALSTIAPSLIDNEQVDVYSNTSTWGALVISSTECSLTGLEVWLTQGGGSGGTQCAIYKADNSRLALTNINSSLTAGIIECAFTSSVILDVGTPYYFAIGSTINGSRYAGAGKGPLIFNSSPKPVFRQQNNRLPETLNPTINSTIVWISSLTS